MISTNSLNKSRFLPLFKHVFKGYLAFFLVVQILSGLFAFFVPHSTLKSIAEMVEYDIGYQSDLTSILVWSTSIFLFAVGLLCTFILALSLFSEIYSKRASAFYFAMPIKRGTYFNVNMLYGIVTVFTSYVLIAVLSIISVKTNTICSPEFYTFDPAQVVKALTVAFLSVLVCYAIFMLFAVLSGRKWHFIVLSLFAGNLVYSTVIGVIEYANSSIWGLSMSSEHSWILSPEAAFLESLEAENILKFVIVLLIQFALIYFVGYTVFKKRKAEIAEAPLVLNIITEIVLLLGAFTVLFSFLATTGASGYVKLGAAVAAVAVASVVVTAIIRKKAFTKKSVKWLIVAVAAVITVVCAVEFLPNAKYKNYVPAASEVESIVFDESADLTEGNSLFFSMFNTLFSSFDYYSFDSYYNTYNFTGEEAKEKVEALHKKFIEQSTIDNQYSDDYFYHGGYSVRITYTLKNGKTVERYYDVCTKDIYDEYIALMQTEEALRQTPQIDLEDEDILFIGVIDYRSDYELNYELDYWDYYEYDPYESSGYLALDEYGTLIDNVVKDKMSEPRDMFAALDQNNAFEVYDPDDHYRDEDGFAFSFSGLLNGEYDDYWDDTEDDDYYPDYHDISIVVYGFYDNVTDEMKEKLSGMSPEELLEYEQEYVLSGGAYIVSESYINLNMEADVNTVAYLESLGLVTK